MRRMHSLARRASFMSHSHFNRLHTQSSRNATIIGIDLGTTNSAVAVVEGGQPRIIENAEGSRTTPSIVAWAKAKDGSSERVVGVPAKRQAITNPKSTFYATKRLIGRRFDEDATKDISKSLSYQVVAGDNGDAWVHSDVTDKKYSPAQISGSILQKLKEYAEANLGFPVTDAVITVPAYFNDSQRQATKDAGQIAGLNVKRVVNEPTAAALAYGLNKTDKGECTVAVYDLGGGTFDVSILSMSDGVFEVMATNGDTTLGGEDFDHALLNHVVGQFKKDHQIDLLQDALAVQRLKDMVETAKIELSSKNSTSISAPFITADASGAKHLDMEISRALLEQLVDKLIVRTLSPMEQCLKDADIGKSAINEVLLVGGMTRMPKVQQFVEDFFGRAPSKAVNPDEVVALGAAIQGGIMGGEFEGIVLVDVTPLSLGIETLGGVFTAMIEKNTAIPTKKMETFSTAADNQTQVGIKVFQGERAMATDNKFLGNFDLVGVPPAPRGRPQIQVVFDIDANGILNVQAKDKGTGKDQSMKIQTSGGLSKDDIEQMTNEAEAMAASDQLKKEAAELRNNADQNMWTAESQLEEHKDKIDDELRTEINEKVAHVRSVRDGDATVLKEALEQLNKTMSKIGEKIYSQSGGQDGSTTTEQATEQQQEGSASSSQDTTDAEFKEKDQ